MKLSARRIVLLVLSCCVMALGLCHLVETIVSLPGLREEMLSMFSDPQISSAISDPERIVGVIVGITVAVCCIGSAYMLMTGLFGLFSALGKYRGGAHIVLTWIYLVFDCIGLIISVVGFVKAGQIDWSVIATVLEIAVAITFIVIAKQIRENGE